MIVAPNTYRQGVVGGFAIEPPALLLSVYFTPNSTWISVGSLAGWVPTVGAELEFLIGDAHSGLPLPAGAAFNYRGPWAANTAYVINDLFVWFDSGGVVQTWLVTTNFTAGASFDPTLDVRQLNFRGNWTATTGYVAGDVALAADTGGITQAWVALSSFTSGPTFAAGSQWAQCLANRTVFYIVSVNAGSIEISNAPGGAAITLASGGFFKAPDTSPALTAYFGNATFGTGSGLTPRLSLGALFAQGTLWAPSSAPTVPAAPANQFSYLGYNSSTGLYWTTNPAGDTTGDAVIGWVETDATDIIAASYQDVPVAAVSSSGSNATGTGFTGDLGALPVTAPATDATLGIVSQAGVPLATAVERPNWDQHGDRPSVMDFIDPALWPSIVDLSCTTDLTAVIQSALRAYPDVFMPAGVYPISSGIVLAPGSHLHGAGRANYPYPITVTRAVNVLNCAESLVWNPIQGATFASTGTLPAPLVAGQTYRVRRITDNSINVIDADGNVIPLTSAGTGVHTMSLFYMATVLLYSGTGIALSSLGGNYINGSDGARVSDLAIVQTAANPVGTGVSTKGWWLGRLSNLLVQGFDVCVNFDGSANGCYRTRIDNSWLMNGRIGLNFDGDTSQTANNCTAADINITGCNIGLYCPPGVNRPEGISLRDINITEPVQRSGDPGPICWEWNGNVSRIGPNIWMEANGGNVPSVQCGRLRGVGNTLAGNVYSYGGNPNTAEIDGVVLVSGVLVVTLRALGITVTVSSSNIGATAHGLVAGDAVYFVNSGIGGALPTPLSAAQEYTILTVVDPNTVIVAATGSSTPVVITGAGTGSQFMEQAHRMQDGYALKISGAAGVVGLNNTPTQPCWYAKSSPYSGYQFGLYVDEALSTPVAITGSYTVGSATFTRALLDYLPGFANVINEPNLPLQRFYAENDGDSEWGSDVGDMVPRAVTNIGNQAGYKFERRGNTAGGQYQAAQLVITAAQFALQAFDQTGAFSFNIWLCNFVDLINQFAVSLSVGGGGFAASLLGNSTTDTGQAQLFAQDDPAITCTASSSGNLMATGSPHGYTAGRMVRVLTALGTLTPGTNYYVISPTSLTFQLSLTAGGAAITLTSGTVQTVASQVYLKARDSHRVNLGSSSGPLVTVDNGLLIVAALQMVGFTPLLPLQLDAAGNVQAAVINLASQVGGLLDWPFIGGGFVDFSAFVAAVKGALGLGISDVTGLAAALAGKATAGAATASGGSPAHTHIQT